MRDNLTSPVLIHALSRKFLSLLLLLLVAMTTVLAACSGESTQTASSKYSGNISVGLDTDVVTLDPLRSSLFIDRQVMLNIYDTLVKINEQGVVVPDLATSWSYTSPTRLIFTLRTGVTFQDGTPFNAEAVAFNINRILSTLSSPRYSEMSSVESVQVIDTSHVQFTLKKAFSPLLATLTDRAGMMLSPRAVQKLGTNLGNAPTNAGCGPFMFSEWVKGDHLTLQRNPHYWLKDPQGNSLPYLQSIRYRPILDGNARVLNLETGTIQVASGLNPNVVPASQSNFHLVYKQVPGLNFNGIVLNTQASPFDNVHVRRALAWGINRQEIVKDYFKGLSIVSQGPIPSMSWAYKRSFAPYTYSIKTAKSELAQGGVPGGISFTLLIPIGFSVEAQYIQSELQPTGILVNIRSETFAALLSDLETHNFQAVLYGWSGRPDPDGNMYSWFHSHGGFNYMQYADPQVDALLEAARTSNDQTQRIQDYQQAEQLIAQDAPFVFINHGVYVEATTSNVKNVTLPPTGIFDFTSVYLDS
jgi:peptide/nickel transport system substrate-binding protein